MEQDNDNVSEQRKDLFRKIPLKVEFNAGRLRFFFNPVTSVFSAILVFGIVAWSLADQENSESYAISIKFWITDNCTWLYISGTQIWMIFIIVVYFKFGHIKLVYDKLSNVNRNPPHHKAVVVDTSPEYSNFSYFCMIFTCGLCPGIFLGGVSEPITHFNQADVTIDFYGKESAVAKAQNAINLSVHLWGLHGFASYTVFGLIIGILTHRKELPLTLRTCFYPLIGRKIFGRVGDVIDTLCITSIIYGVSVSLVLGAQLLNAGFQMWNNDIEVTKTNQLYILWGLTFMSTLSVISGLEIGVKRLSQSCVLASALILMMLAMSYKTSHILNVFVQSVGYYLQNLVGMGLYTGAFEQRGFGSALQDESLKTKQKEWMNNNTIFYWGWWIAWSPFVGLFIAKISKGRTIKEIIMYSFFLPSIAIFAWLITFGTIAIDMEMNAINHNISCSSFDTKTNTIQQLVALRLNDSKYQRIDRLSCYDPNHQIFRMMEQFGDIAQLLNVLAVVALILYFVTSSDSASLIVDSVASNGEEDPPVIQRVFWALCEGAVGTALIYHAQSDGFPALKAFTVMWGLPVTVVLNFCCVALWRVLKDEPGWHLDLYGIWEDPFKKYELGKNSTLFIQALLVPWFLMGQISTKLEKKTEKGFVYVDYVIPFVLFNSWIVFLFMSIGLTNLDKIGWSLLVIFLCYCATIRKQIRERHEIAGGIVGDILMMILYPTTIMQMYQQVNNLTHVKKCEVRDNGALEFGDLSLPA